MRKHQEIWFSIGWRESYPIHARFIPPTCTASPRPTCVIRKHLLADMFSAKRGFGIFQDYYGNSTPIYAPVCNSSDYRCPIRKPRILGSLGHLEAVGEFVRRPFAYLSKGPRSPSLSLLPSPPPSNVASLWAVYYYPLPENHKKPQKRITSEPLEEGCWGCVPHFIHGG